MLFLPFQKNDTSIQFNHHITYKAVNTNYPKSTGIVALLCFLFITSSVFSQEESVVSIGINGKLTTIDHAVYMQKVSTKSSNVSNVETNMLKDSVWKKICSEQYKKLNDSTYQIKGKGENLPENTIRHFVRQSDKSYKFRDIVKDQVIRVGKASSVMPLLLQGLVTEYYQNGNKKSVSEYNNNELVSNENWDKNGDKYIDNIFYSADTEPTFNGGTNVMNQHIIQGLKDAGINYSTIEGSLIVGFVVMENGTLDGIKIIQGLGPEINTAVFNSISTLALRGNWTPAKLNGQTIRYFQIFPINFIQQVQRIRYATVRHDDLHYGLNN